MSLDTLLAEPELTYLYRTYRMDPAAPKFPFLVGKYAALALLAQTTDPGAFGIDYGTEAGFFAADWMKRLSRPYAHVFVCVAHPSDLPPEKLTIENGAWVGMVTQIGPTPKHIYHLPESGAEEPLGDELETHWNQTGTWVHPAHRRHGLAQQIIEAGVSYAAATICGTVQQARVRALTSPVNAISKCLYGKQGFPHVGGCTPGEGMKANGNEGFPFHGRSDFPAEFMNSRVGVVMERVVKKKDLK